MNQRIKQGLGLGLGSKRKSSANNNSVQVATQPGQQLPGALPGRPGGPLSTSSSASSLATMNQPGPGQRPPSYTAGYPPATMSNRTTSPPMPPGAGNTRTPPSQVMGGPPPINTAAPPHTTVAGGYPPQYGPPGPVGQPLQGPVGGAYHTAPQGTLGAPVPYAARNNAVEVEGAGRSKSQLIVGIDFVSSHVQLQDTIN
jgi:hypothetical protein